MLSHSLVLWGLGLPELFVLMSLTLVAARYVRTFNVPDQVEQLRRKVHFLRATPLQRFPGLLQAGNADRAW